MADSTTGSSNTQDLNELLGQSPFGRLLNIQGADGNNLTAQDIFGNLGSGGGNAFGGGTGSSAGAGGASSNQDLPYGGNPFAGDNFWNIFAGGVNPSNPTSNASTTGGGGNPFAGGGAPATGGGGNPFAGGGAPATGGGGNPFVGGGAPATGGGGNPFAGGGAPATGGGGNPFAGGGAPATGSGGNPFAGGGAPATGGGGNPFAGGGAPATGGGGNPFAGGGAPATGGGGNPSGSPSPTTGENTQDLNALLSQSPFAPLLDIEKADGSKLTVEDIFGNLPASSSPLANGSNPFADDNFWNTFGGGVNPATFSSSNIPAFGGGSPQGLPTGASTPVPEPSSVIGLAVIGVGIAATKFRQYQRRAVKAFNK